MSGQKLAFDYLVIGAGSAGCLVAAELAKFATVGLFEAGEQAPQTCHLRRPADFLRCFGSQDDWGLVSVPQSALGGRQVRFPRGRGVGGSTRINASIWLPPEASCCQRFAAASGGAWTEEQIAEACQQVESEVQPEEPRWIAETTEAFVQAAQSLNLDAVPFKRMNLRGQRRTAADVWLEEKRPERTAENPLTLLTGVTVERLVIEGEIARGVLLAKDGEQFEVQARRGVVVCCGTIQTPHLLWSSGIGCPDSLERLGIKPTICAPQVGQGLGDHLVVPILFETTNVTPFPATWSPRDLARWQQLGSGPIASNIAEAGLLLKASMLTEPDRTQPVSDEPCMQLFCTPTDYLGFPGRSSSQAIPAGAMTIGIVVSRPQSVGCLRMNEDKQIEIDPGYWDDSRDRTLAFQGLQIVRRLAATPPLGELIASERSPGAKGIDEMGFARLASRTAQSLYHPVGTCRLGTDSGAVVEPTFRLRGAENIWIVDASVFPFMPIANPNAFTMGLARLAVGSVLGGRP